MTEHASSYPPALLEELASEQPSAPFFSRPTIAPVASLYSHLVSLDKEGRPSFSVHPRAQLENHNVVELIGPALPPSLSPHLQAVVNLGYATQPSLTLNGFVRNLEEHETHLARSASPLLPALRLIVYFILDAYAMADPSHLLCVLASVPSPRALLERRETRSATLKHAYEALCGNSNLLLYLVDGTFSVEAALRDPGVCSFLAGRLNGLPLDTVLDRAVAYHRAWVDHDRFPPPTTPSDPVDEALVRLGFLDQCSLFQCLVARQTLVDMSRINQFIALHHDVDSPDMLTPSDPDSLDLALRVHSVALVMNAGRLADDTVLLPYIAKSRNVFYGNGTEVQCYRGEDARNQTVVRHCHTRGIHELSELLRNVFTLGDSGRGSVRTSPYETVVFEVDPLAISRTALFLSYHRMFTVCLRPAPAAIEALTLPRQIVARAVAESLDYWHPHTTGKPLKSLAAIIAELLVLSATGDGPFVIENESDCLVDIGRMGPLRARLRHWVNNAGPLVVTEEAAHRNGPELIYLASQCSEVNKITLAFSETFIRSMVDRALGVSSSRG